MKAPDTVIENKSYPYLSPKVSHWMNRVLVNKKTLKTLIKKFGSPININNPEMFADNASLFKRILLKSNIPYKIFFARKPNKCVAYVKEAKKLNIGVDTASFNELKQTVGLGLPSESIVLTAAIKDEKTLELAVKNDVLVIADNYDELFLTNKIAQKYGKRQKVGIRISGFIIDNAKLYSRFGFDIDGLENLFKKFEEGVFSNLVFSGFHFHLNGYSVKERAEALLYLIKIAKNLKKLNILTKFIDIGGGFPVCYLKSETEWRSFEKELKLAVLGKREPITFLNNGLGLANFNGKLKGKENYYPYFCKNYKQKFLEEIFFYKKANKSILQILAGSGIELRLEPGRSLLDQCGITLARVAFCKRDQNADWLIGLEMNMTQLMSSSEDFLVDPVVVNFNPQKNTGQVSGYFVGAYCLERDVILKRKITLKKLPKIGDLVCFINTAGYMMHFFESRSHQFDLAKNLIIKPGKRIFKYLPDR